MRAHSETTLVSKHEGLVVCAVLFVSIVLAYAASLANAPVWDDRALVVDNANLHSWAGLWRIATTDLWSASAQGERSSFYRPLTMLTYAVNAFVGGGSAASFRFGNVAIHAANAMLLAQLVRRALGASWRAAGWVALLWSLAPIASEPVFWISGRFDLLVVTFALLSILASRRDDAVGSVATVVAVAAGLLCKESFTGWLPILVVHDLFVRRASLCALLPRYIAIGAATAAYFIARRALGIPSLDVVTHTSARAIVESFLFLVVTFFRVLAWPSNLDPFRPYATPSLAKLVCALALLAVVVGAPIAAYARSRGSDAARFAILGALWFLLATAPSAVVGPNLDMIGDRYAYLPVVGLFLVAAAAVADARALAHASSRIAARVAPWACAALAVTWGAVVALHAAAWRDDRALAESSLRSSPENPYALYSLAVFAAQSGSIDEADALLARSVAGNPDSWRTWNAVCFVRLQQSRLAEAERGCKEGLARNPDNPRGWVNLASVYVRAGRWPEASTAAERAIAIKPSYAEARYLAAVGAANLGDASRARAHIAVGLAADPAHAGLRDLDRQLRERNL